jgi:hypothetical protein
VNPIANQTSTLNPHGFTSVTLGLIWRDGCASHEERLYVERFNIRHQAGLLPPEIGQRIVGMQAGEQLKTIIQPGDLLDRWQSTRQISIQTSAFNRHPHQRLEIEPRLGRFYPQSGNTRSHH